MVTVSKRARRVSADLKVHEELSVFVGSGANQQTLKVSAATDRETTG